MTAPAPRPINPYQVTLGILAFVALIVGIVLLLVNQPHETLTGFEEGMRRLPWTGEPLP